MYKKITVLLSGLLLAGCSSIEHHSEVLEKSPLPEIASKRFHPKQVWSNTNTSGVGKTDGRLNLAVTNSAIFVADHKGHLVSLDPKSGKVQWQRETQATFTAGPIVSAQEIFLGTESGNLLNFSKKEGVSGWRASVKSPILAAPVVDSKQIFVHTLGGKLIALNSKTGEQQWEYQSTLPALVLQHSARPVLSDQNVIVGFASGQLAAFNRLNGYMIWERALSNFKGRSDLQRMIDVSSTPVVHNDVVYAISYQGSLVALQADSGNLIWEKQISSYSELVLTKKALYVADDRGVLWAIQPQNGKVLWKQEGLFGRQLFIVAYGNDLVAADEDGYLHWISQVDGAFKARLSFNGQGVNVPPIVQNSILYVMGREGKVAAYTTEANP